MTDMEKNVDFLDFALSHGLIFPGDFKDRLKERVLKGLQGISYKSVPGMQALRGKTGIQFSGTAAAWSATNSGYEHFSQSTVGSHTDYTMTEIADGRYLIFFEALIGGSAGYVGLSVNGSAPSDAEAIRSIGGPFSNSVMVVTKDLTNDDNNTLELLGKTTSGSFIVDNPRILIIKIANI